MRKNFVFLAFFCLSIPLYSQNQAELIGEFDWSYSWYSSIKLALRDSGNFLISQSSDIGGSRTYGKWTVEGSFLKLAPTKYVWATNKSKWKEGPVGNFIFGRIEILSRDRLFVVESGKSHIHLNRSLTSEDGPYKVFFPPHKSRVSDLVDSTALARIAKRLSKWNHDYTYEIELLPQTSKKDADVDPYIGLKRCREIMNYFVEQHGLGTSRFVIRDMDDLDKDGDSEIEILIIHKY